MKKITTGLVLVGLACLAAAFGAGFAIYLRPAQATRNAAGTYSLPTPGVPFQSNQVISSTQMNNTFNDVSSTLTDSLDRNGKGGMLAALRGIDGTVTAPAFSYTSETGSGYFRNAAGDVRMSILGALVGQWTANGLRVANGVVATPSLSFTNETGTGWYRAAAGDIRFAVSGVDKQFLSATGLGIGVAPAFLFHTGAPASGDAAAQIGTTLPLMLRTNNPGIGFNQYYDGVNDKRVATGYAADLIQDPSGNVLMRTSGTGAAGNVTPTTRASYSPSGFTIGASGTAISGSFRGTLSWTPGTVNANTCVVNTVTVTGAAAGAECAINAVTTTPNNFSTMCAAGANVCTIQLCNPTLVNATGPSGTYSCRVFNP